jgi:hypothetical protein
MRVPVMGLGIGYLIRPDRGPTSATYGKDGTPEYLTRGANHIAQLLSEWMLFC